MKEIGRTANVTKDMTDKIFEDGHKGIDIKDNVGVTVEVTDFTLYQKEQEKDNSTDLSLKFWDKEGNDWYTGSQVFIKSFMRMIKMVFDDKTGNLSQNLFVTVKKEKSKNGRDYYDIEEAPKKQPSNAWKNMEW